MAATQFLHGVEVIQVDAGPRPVQTVTSGVIGIVGTAPDSQPEVKATAATGVVGSNNAITWTAVQDGILGNDVSIELKDPKANSASLSVTVTGKNIVVNLATSSGGAITSTATQVNTAIAASTAASALVTSANTGASTGAGTVAAVKRTYLSGGVDEAFPLNKPTLVAGSQVEAAKLGSTGTLPDAMKRILAQCGAVVVVVRVAQENGDDEDAATIANVIGGTNTDGTYEGVHALLAAESTLGVSPRILIAPGFTHQRSGDTANAVVAELLGIADRLRAIIVADCPNTTDSAAITYRGDWGSKRLYIHDPFDKVVDASGNVVEVPASSRIAGTIASSDNERGFWWSPSNNEAYGIVGTARAIDFKLGDAASRANILNENEVATTIRQDGFRLWGNRTCSADPQWQFLSVVRTADIINDSILRAHLWAVDRNITKTYVQDVVESVNAYLRYLTSLGAILGGTCYADPDLNDAAAITNGQVFFNIDFTPPYPAEHITFRSSIVNDYISTILA